MGINQVDITTVEEWLRRLHDGLTTRLATLDGGSGFEADSWERPGGGGGESRVLEGGELFEKAGVNFSLVHGDRLPPSRSASSGMLAASIFCRKSSTSTVCSSPSPSSRWIARSCSTGGRSTRRTPAAA